MSNVTEKQLLSRLEVVLYQLDVPNVPVMMEVIDPVSKKSRLELRNQFKKIVKTFKSFDYNRKVNELVALEAKLYDYQLEKLAKQDELKKESASDTSENGTT